MTSTTPSPDSKPDSGPEPGSDRTRPLRIDPRLPLAEGIRRAVLEQIELAEAAAARIPLSHESVERAGQVRRSRKAIKRARAILRLLRGRAHRGTLDGIDDDLRDAGRRLSAQRDRDVHRETIARLLGEDPPQKTDPRSADRRNPPAAVVAETDHAAELVQARMRDLEDRVETLAIDPIAWSRMRRLIAKRWRRVRRRLRRGTARGGDERLHATRKACGRLEAQLMLFESMGDRRIRRRRKRISRVYETIGADRDLALARARLDEIEEDLRDAIDRRRRELSDELDRRVARLRRHPRRSWSMLAPPPLPGDSAS